MNYRLLKAAVLTTLVAASVALPLVVHYRFTGRFRDGEETLRRQADELAQLTEENLQLSNSAATAGTRSPSGEQFQELLRLRGEVVRLREQTNALGRLTAENQRLEAGSSVPASTRAPMTPGEWSEALAAETSDAMKQIVAALPAAMQAYALDHTGHTPKDFSELRKYFPKNEGRRMAGLYTFEFVRDQGPQPGDTLILRETGLRTLPDSQRQVRVYGFSDGTIVSLPQAERMGLYTSMDKNILPAAIMEEDFRDWEKKYLKSPPPPQ